MGLEILVDIGIVDRDAARFGFLDDKHIVDHRVEHLRGKGFLVIGPKLVFDLLHDRLDLLQVTQDLLLLVCIGHRLGKLLIGLVGAVILVVERNELTAFELGALLKVAHCDLSPVDGHDRP